MKTLRNTTLFAVLLLIGGISSCKKDGATPDEQAQFKNSAQLFLDDNSSITLEGNDVVSASYADNTLKINFSKDGTDVALQIPNYDINSTSQVTFNNTSVALSLTRGQKGYNSAYIFVPVIVGNPPRPVFVTDKLISVTANNLKVDANTTDIAINIQSGSQLITAPVSNGSGPVYQTLSFIAGAGGKPNMINVRIKN